MTLFQLIMLGISAFFAYKVYEHIQTLQDPKEEEDQRSADAFSPFDATTLIEKADEEMQKGDLQKALAIYSEANIKAPHDAETLFKMGYVLSQQNRDDEALEYYKEALELEPNNTYIHQAMASTYRKMKEYANAQKHLDASLAIDETNPITYYNYGNLLVDQNRLEEAKAMYEKAVELKSDFTEAQEELQKIQEKSA